MPRFFCPTALPTGSELALPAGAARHVQVLRLQPGDGITLFNNGPGWSGPFPGGEFSATVIHMGRNEVRVQVQDHHLVEREGFHQIHLAVGMPANDRMDWLVEKATELGVASIQPLMTERSVLRLSGDRSEKKVVHWQSVAIAASEQCGGNRVPLVHAVQTLQHWLRSPTESTRAMLLSLREDAKPVRAATAQLTCDLPSAPLVFLSGPEGGLSAAEEQLAIERGFTPATLGTRVLRAETAALAALAVLQI